MSLTENCVEIEDLPDEVLEYILSLISPYKDLHDSMQVSKRWRRCVMNVAKTKLRNFHKAIVDFDVSWDSLTPKDDVAPTISQRYSHNAAIHDNFMYVFGGCTCSRTTFNDLWRFDLSTRTWMRPVARGTYPSPKACSSLARYKDVLVLFGGWAYPPSYPLYQSSLLFNELHIYDIPDNRWTCINSIDGPPPTAAHSVSVVGDWMVLFGGIYKPSAAVHCEKSNDIWKLHLGTWTWHKQEVEGEPRPKGRLGQTQVILDEKTLLIFGGSGGTALNYSDAWTLNMDGDVWKWKPMEILGKTNMPNSIWTNPGCKVGDKVVVLNRIREDQECSVTYYPKNVWSDRRNPHEDVSKSARIDLANREPDRDENVNGKRGVLRNKREEEADRPGSSNNQPPSVNNLAPANNINQLAAFNVPNNKNQSKSDRMREQRLAKLLEMKEEIKKKKREETATSNLHYLGIYVLDLSNALNPTNPSVTWLPPKNVEHGPEETILYTLLEGKAELVMFGGIRKDPSSLGFSLNVINNKISNSVNFISAPNYVI